MMMTEQSQIRDRDREVRDLIDRIEDAVDLATVATAIAVYVETQGSIGGVKVA